MTVTHQIRTTITSTDFYRTNKDGNPQFTVHTTAGSWKTVDGGSVGYGIENAEFQGEVILTIDRDKVVGVSTVDGERFAGRQS